ncbi:unnamed protein product [Paramecium sonneborni]|uniref:Uncharacterized protein n=1 Tax=Paramecium sonneborni TaxID=65129 RepID=A0A8S1LIN0_9CILI|nr:unnamed protein product [Paramecium sonneborni]
MIHHKFGQLNSAIQLYYSVRNVQIYIMKKGAVIFVHKYTLMIIKIFWMGKNGLVVIVKVAKNGLDSFIM